MNDVRVGQTRMCRVNRRPYVIVDVDSAGEFGIDFRQSGRPGGVRFSAAELRDDEIVGAPEEEENVTQAIEPEAGQKRQSCTGSFYEILHIGNTRALIRFDNTGEETSRLLKNVRADTLISPLPLPEGWESLDDETSFEYRDTVDDTLWISKRSSSSYAGATRGSGPWVRMKSSGAAVHVPIADLRAILDRIEADLTNEEE